MYAITCVTILFRYLLINKSEGSSAARSAMERRILIITVLLLLLGVGLLVYDSVPAKVTISQGTPCSPISAPPCNEGTFPGVIQIIPDGANPANKFKLARKRFYLSSHPFNLSATVSLETAPTLRGFYGSARASPPLIAWLEENHCETIYCRELTAAEAKCEDMDQNKCVPEFTAAYRNALADVKDANLALKMITNYAPLSEPKLRIGYYEARTDWLRKAISKIENTLGNGYRIKTTVTDKDGIGFFYDLCPGSYYISSVAPIDVDGAEVVWETTKPVKVEGPPDVKSAVRVTLAFPPSKDKKNFFVGKPVSDFTAVKPAAQ
jgi:hypothetical protein